MYVPRYFIIKNKNIKTHHLPSEEISPHDGESFSGETSNKKFAKNEFQTL